MENCDTITVVWNKHGEGSLIGAFTDNKLVEKIKRIAALTEQTHYIGIFTVEVNRINKEALVKDLPSDFDINQF